MATGYVGILTVELHFPENGSLKGKRKHVKSAKAQLHERFGASVAEVDHHDLWQRSTLAAALTGTSIALADGLSGASEDAWRTAILASVVVVVAAIVGGFTRQLWVEAERRQQQTVDQMTRMSVANDLLHQLHDVVQTLPSSLDLSDVISSARGGR